MPRVHSADDAMLFTSRSDGSPNVVKEAMATELPVVSTRTGDVAERIGGLPGCHVGNPDADELAAALLAAVEHGPVPEARAAVASLSLSTIAHRIISVYERVLTNGRR